MKQTIFAQRLFVIAAIMSTLLFMSNLNISNAQEEDEASSSEETNVVRDSATILLEGKALAGNEFIHLYDTTPYMIINGHVAAKLPCDDNSESPIKVLIGSAPDLVAAEFETIAELSTPGTACLYHVDLESKQGGNASEIITDIAIQNPTAEPIEFGPTTSVVIGINEIMKGAHEAHAEGETGEEHAEGETGEEHSDDSSNKTGEE